MSGETASAVLRKPFRPEEIGKLPRVTCPKCSDPKKNGPCDEHRKSKCPECKAYVSERHIHIDYVGHADVTARLLEADPEWNWEPLATDEHGLPVFDTDRNDSPVGLWIRLTAGGVTRLGYGSVPSGQNDAVKVLIGDALRNAAMRFGVALDLWAKGDRADPTAENATASAGQAARRAARPAGARQPASGGGQGVTSLPDADESVIAEWGAKIDGITSQEDADTADAELKAIYDKGRMNATTAGAIRRAIKIKASAVAAGSQPAAAGASGNGHQP